MKIVIVDNFDREMYDDRLAAENLPDKEAKLMADKMNAELSEHEDIFYRAFPDNYKLRTFTP